MKDQVYSSKETADEYFWRQEAERKEDDELYKINEKPNDDDIDRYKETKDE